MENPKEPVLKQLKRPKSASSYSKRTNTYVVAFAVQEPPLSDISKMTTNNQRNNENTISSESAVGSVTSAKTFTISPACDLPDILNVPTTSEVKIDMLDSNQFGDTDKTSSQTNSCLEVDNITADEQPKMIFNASKHMKRCKKHHNSLRKKPKSYKRVTKIKNIHFKYKKNKNNIIKRLEKSYVKAKMKSSNSRGIENIYTDTISKVVSLSGILRKVLAKENLLAETEQLSSCGSQNTLVNYSSFSFNSDDTYSIKTVNSVNPVSSNTNTTPYKTDLKIAVAVAFSPVKPNNERVMYKIPNIDECIDKGNITSTDTIQFSGMELTSQVPSDDSGNKTSNSAKDLICNEKYKSTETLTGLEKDILNLISDDDTFTIGRVSSESNKSSIRSELESTSMSDSIITDNVNNIDINHNTVAQRTTLLDTVIHLGFYPEMTPSTSSGGNFDNGFDGDMVKTNLMETYSMKHEKNTITVQNHELSKNVLQKSFDAESKNQHNNISLPNEVAIKAIMKHVEHPQKKTCSEEVNNLPLDMIEIWNRLSVVLDLAIKRLEDTITDKLIKEVQKSLSAFGTKIKDEVQNSNDSLMNSQEMKTEKHEVEMLHKEVFVVDENFGNGHHRAHQCELVQNQIIDQLMLNLSVKGAKPLANSQISLKSLKKPQLIRNYFEILKQPVVDVEVGKGDTVTVATTTSRNVLQKHQTLQRFKGLFASPLSFLRENLLVITSVPTFFIILLCLYGIVTLIAKPW